MNKDRVSDFDTHKFDLGSFRSGAFGKGYSERMLRRELGQADRSSRRERRRMGRV